MFSIDVKVKKKFVFGLINWTKTVRRNIWESWKDVPIDRRADLLLYCLKHPKEANLYALRDMLDFGKGFLSLDLYAAEDFGYLLKTMDWLKIEDSSEAIVPNFVHKNTAYELIKPNFENGLAIEYALLDRFYSEYCNTESNESLLKLCAVVCRTIDTKGISEAIKTTDDVDNRAKKLEDLPIELIINVFCYVKGVRNLISELYGEHLFKTPLTDEEKEYLQNRGIEQEEEDEPDPLGWYSLFMVMAQQPTNLSAIENMNFHTLCVWRVKELQAANKNKTQNVDNEL